MEATPTPERAKAALVLNRSKLDELRRANGIETEADLAAVIGVDTATLWRATNGKPVSGGFVARVVIAFPHASMRSLFDPVVLEHAS